MNRKKDEKDLVYKKFYCKLYEKLGERHYRLNEFDFEIKNYFEEAEYDIRIHYRKEYSSIMVRDTHYKERRRTFYWSINQP